MWDNQLHENSYVWHERNIQNVIRAVTKRPSPDWSAKEDLEEETEESVRVKETWRLYWQDSNRCIKISRWKE